MFNEASMPKVNSSSNIKHGTIAGSATAAQLPDVPCSYVYLKGQSNNAGSVYIGSSTNVTVPAGSTNATAGYEIDAGQTELFTVSNLNLLWRICDNAGDDLTYIAYV